MTQAETHRILFAFDTVEALVREVETNITAGRIYIPGGVGGVERQPCVVVLQHPGSGAEFEFSGECVWAREDGIGVQFAPPDAKLLADLKTFVESEGDEAEAAGIPKNVFERVRNLSTTEQQQMAREGTQPERVALERRYGKLVWEALLRNSRITPPEVAKIARNGAIPKPYVEIIVNNATWLKIPEIRRALLSNPRCGGEFVQRILRLLPKNELKMVPGQTIYTMEVRNAARTMLARMSGQIK